MAVFLQAIVGATAAASSQPIDIQVSAGIRPRQHHLQGSCHPLTRDLIPVEGKHLPYRTRGIELTVHIEFSQVLLGMASLLTCGRAGGPTTMASTGVSPGVDGMSATTGRRQFGFGFGRRRAAGAMGQGGGAGAVLLDDAVYPATGGVAPGTMENQMVMGAGAYPAGVGFGMGPGMGVAPEIGASRAMCGLGGPGAMPYGSAVHGMPNDAVPGYVGSGPGIDAAY